MMDEDRWDDRQLVRLNYAETPTRPWTRLDYADLVIRVVLIACFGSAGFWVVVMVVRMVVG